MLPTIVWKNRRPILIFVFLALLAVLGGPYRFADGNSGRYLPTLYRIMDPSLFQNDPFTVAITRFETVFYIWLGQLLFFFQVPILQVESVFYGLYVISKLALIGLLYFLVRSLKRNIGVFLILGIWAAHTKGASVGGSVMFSYILNHATLAILLGITALGFLLRQKPFWFWTILGCTLFIHSLIALHLALMVFPVIAFQDGFRFSKSALIGMTVFGMALLVYLLWMTPSAFNSQEAILFITKFGESVHVAPQNQSALSWTNMVGRVGLALLAYRSYFYGQKIFARMAGFVFVGSLLSLALGLAATISGSLQLAQLQPLRMFMWINFLIFVLLACAIEAGYKKDRSMSAILFVVVLLNVLDSEWGLAWIFFAIASFLARWLSGRWPRTAFLSAPTSLLLVSILLTLTALVKSLTVFSHTLSFHEPVPVLVLAMCLPLFLDRFRKGIWKWRLVTIVLFVTLVGHSINVHNYFNVRRDREFNEIGRWIALNTPKDARFITAVRRGRDSNFRARALRVSVNEDQQALFWVAPLVGQENAKMAQQVKSAEKDKNWDLNMLLSLAQDWTTNYLLIEGNYFPESPVLHTQGHFRVMKIP